jgi:signal transduction histidine kinase
LPDTVGISFYRFVQEALTNVAKHAEATEVQVTMAYDGVTLALQVRDDGKGFDGIVKADEDRSAGIGLLGMQERFRLLGGECQIDSTPGQGTYLVARCRVPTGAALPV